MNHKAKGSRLEYSVRDAFKAKGIEARRIPFSGSLGGDLDCDVKVMIGDTWRKVECKSKKSGWATLYRLLENNYAVALKADRRETLLVIRLDDYMK